MLKSLKVYAFHNDREIGVLVDYQVCWGTVMG
jgi:hypothetical protein